MVKHLWSQESWLRGSGDLGVISAQPGMGGSELGKASQEQRCGRGKKLGEEAEKEETRRPGQPRLMLKIAGGKTRTGKYLTASRIPGVGADRSQADVHPRDEGKRSYFTETWL